MRTLFLLGLLLLAGCQGFGSRTAIDEQQRYARERLALPDEGRPLGEGVSRPGTLFRQNN